MQDKNYASIGRVKFDGTIQDRSCMLIMAECSMLHIVFSDMLMVCRFSRFFSLVKLGIAH